MKYVGSLNADQRNFRLGKHSHRIRSIDLLRGLVMILMALDHTRDFFSIVHFDPLDLSHTTPEYFFTRWITHFCAPVFVFLSGTSAFLYGQRVDSKKELSKYLFTRGLLLVILELTLVRWGWQFNWNYSYSWVQVIWVLGISMIILAWLVHYSIKRIMIFGISMVILHNLLDGIRATDLGSLGWLWLFLHEEGTITLGSKGVLWVVYPLIPWIGVMAVGYGLGKVFKKQSHERKKILLQLGLIITMAFLVIRGINLYGDPQPWSLQKNFIFTLMSFLNCEKYPPSLSFLLMTLGPAMILLSLFENVHGWKKKFLLPYGRTPLLFYLVHVPIIHLLSFLLALKMGLNTSFQFNNSDPSTWPAGFGLNLPGIYLVWIAVVLALYPLCSLYAAIKSRKKSKLLSYL